MRKRNQGSIAGPPPQNVAIVLIRPQFAGNIGSVCRAMKNMGLSRLILVAPEQDPLSPEGRMMAVSAIDLLKKAEIYPSQEEALAGFRWDLGPQGKESRSVHLAPGDFFGDHRPCRFGTGGAPLRAGGPRVDQ
jgi:hypothetical protein